MEILLLAALAVILQCNYGWKKRKYYMDITAASAAYIHRIYGWKVEYIMRYYGQYRLPYHCYYVVKRILWRYNSSNSCVLLAYFYGKWDGDMIAVFGCIIHCVIFFCVYFFLFFFLHVYVRNGLQVHLW